MSSSGLLSEVKNFHPHNLEVALGEQLLHGNKRVFSDVKPGSSTAGNKNEGKGGAKNELKGAIDNAKKIASQALHGGNTGAHAGGNSGDVSALRNDHNDLASKVEKLTALVQELQLELATFRQGKTAAAPAAAPAKAATPEPAGGDDDDDFDLFGSEDEEDAEKKKIVEERLKAYNEKKSKKPGPIAKSSVILDVKPWDDETDMVEMEKLVRSIELDGLVWGGAKLIPIGYGIKKLQIISVIEDLKVSVDDLIEKITGDFEDHVQSVDIAAFNKI